MAAAAVPESTPPSMAMGAAPPSESQVAASTTAAATATATATAPAAEAGLDNGSAAESSAPKVRKPITSTWN